MRDVVDGLSARGLAWLSGDRIELPRRLAERFEAGLSRFRPLDQVGRQARVDELRIAVAGLGADPAGLKKPELINRLAALYNDPEVVARALAALPAAAREYLDLVRTTGFVDFGYRAPSTGPVHVLVRAGLLVASAYLPAELPREVAAALLLGSRRGLRGRPQLPVSADAPDAGRAGAEAALLALTTLLDEARHRPLAALKKGGVGTRERTRLATKIGLSEPALWIDVAAAAGLLSRTTAGYAPTAGYDAWRAETAVRRWAVAVVAWFGMEVTPTSRETEDGEVPPPEPLGSAGGLVRRALLRAGAEGRSLRAAAEEISWFCPLQPYDEAGLQRKLVAATREAELLGLVAGDRLSALGEHLLAAVDRSDPAEALVAAVADLLPDARTLLVLQSDLTALVSGQPSAAAAQLLAEAAVPESRGVAATWRFSPESVRSALDLGWTADTLRDELAAISGRPLPQPLDYLIADVGRRHGAVRVRGGQACITGSEAEIAEILATRSLRTLHLSRLAPTVLTSPFELDQVVDRLRKAGFMPMPEDAGGVTIVPDRTDGTDRASVRTVRPRRRVEAGELAARLPATPVAADRGPPRSSRSPSWPPSWTRPRSPCSPTPSTTATTCTSSTATGRATAAPGSSVPNSSTAGGWSRGATCGRPRGSSRYPASSPSACPLPDGAATRPVPSCADNSRRLCSASRPAWPQARRGRRPLPRSCPLRQSYPDDAPRVTPEPRVAFAGTQSVPGRELTSFGDGTWQVGVDVLPGTYTSAAARTAVMHSAQPSRGAAPRVTGTWPTGDGTPDRRRRPGGRGYRC